jgi:hypothetical protein
MSGITSALRRQVEQMMTMDLRLAALEQGGVGTKGAKGDPGDGVQLRVLGQWLQIRTVAGDGALGTWTNLFNLGQLTGPEGPQASPSDITSAVNAYLQDHPAQVTQEQVQAAMIAYLQEHPPPPGPPGPPGPAPTEEELEEHLATQVSAYLAAHPPPSGPAGATGPGPSDAQIMGVITEYLALNPPPRGEKGEKGDKGDRGPSPNPHSIAEAVSAYLTDHPPDPGPQGSIGPDGPAGPAGGKGDPGAPGAPGATPQLTIGTVATLAAGASATASITGTAANPVLNLGIPRGATGTTGTAGTAGFLDGKSINLPGVTLLAANTVREYTVTWNYALPNSNYNITFLPDQTALGANFTFAVKSGSKTTTQVVVQVTNNSILTLGAAAVHVIARSA